MKAQRTFSEAESFDYSAARALVKRCVAFGWIKPASPAPEIPAVNRPAVARAGIKRKSKSRRR
jgi:hypothetical protein